MEDIHKLPVGIAALSLLVAWMSLAEKVKYSWICSSCILC